MFSEPEIQYLKSQRLARLATISNKGQPDVVPVGFEFDSTYFWVGSHDQDIFHRTQKYYNVKNGNKLVALVIDDLESVSPWKPRGIKVYGIAEVIEHNGKFGNGNYLRIIPKISWAWGLSGIQTTKGDFRLKTIHNTI